MSRPVGCIIEVIVGSQAHGLATESSDTDRAGAFVLPSDEFLGIDPPLERKLSRVSTDPDSTYHEVGKLFRLAAAGNPSVLEILFAEGQEYVSRAGQLIIDNRQLFLSRAVVSPHLGFANSEFNKALFSTKKSRAKSIRHSFRLLEQLGKILMFGTFTPRVADPSFYHSLPELDNSQLEKAFHQQVEIVKSIKSTLPDQVDRPALNDLLLVVRDLHSRAQRVQ